MVPGQLRRIRRNDKNQKPRPNSTPKSKIQTDQTKV